MTLPPLGPLSQTGKSDVENPGVLDVLQAKFSKENMYFFATALLISPTILVESCPPSCLFGAILRLYVLSNTEYANLLPSVVIPSVFCKSLYCK